MNRTLTEKEIQKVYERDGRRCRYCGDTKGPFEIDHVYPYVKGGETTIENSVVSCQRCNRKKHDKVGIWPIPLSQKRSTSFVGFISSWIAFILFMLIVGWVAITTEDLILEVIATMAWICSFLLIVIVTNWRS